ncbi:hypothetical protein AOLI_G00296780 [Acnodon oligacanthus]
MPTYTSAMLVSTPLTTSFVRLADSQRAHMSNPAGCSSTQRDRGRVSSEQRRDVMKLVLAADSARLEPHVSAGRTGRVSDRDTLIPCRWTQAHPASPDAGSEQALDLGFF